MKFSPRYSSFLQAVCYLLLVSACQVVSVAQRVHFSILNARRLFVDTKLVYYALFIVYQLYSFIFILVFSQPCNVIWGRCGLALSLKHSNNATYTANTRVRKKNQTRDRKKHNITIKKPHPGKPN